MELLQGSDSSAIVLYKWETVLVFNLRSESNCTGEDERTEGEREVGGGGRPGLWPLPGGLWVVVLVYCLSALIFIKLWGQMQSDAMALLWKGGVPSALGRERPACGMSPSRPLET